ncbi:MAG TPA: hypothetical protein VMF89_34700, partial [Polyangiales bacterium]|nr:hypothetical protein [Polyangiales bacterium]
MRDVWRLLQIDPTHDARAIKTAYARLLRGTRPDDDAAAYQALREAYDRALDWAKRSAIEPAPALDAPEASYESVAQPVAAASWEANRTHELPTTDPDAPHWHTHEPEPEPEP